MWRHGNGISLPCHPAYSRLNPSHQNKKHLKERKKVHGKKKETKKENKSMFPSIKDVCLLESPREAQNKRKKKIKTKFHSISERAKKFAILNSVIREKEKSLSDFNLLPKKEVQPHKSSLFHSLLTEDETFAEVSRRSKPLVLVEGNWGRKLGISGHALVLKNELSSGFDISCLGGERRRRRRNS